MKQVRLARFSFLCVIGDEALFWHKSLCTLCYEAKLSFPTRFGRILLWVVVGGGVRWQGKVEQQSKVGMILKITLLN